MRVSHDVSNETDNEDPRSGYQLVDGWPNYPSEMRFEMGSGIAVDDEGTVYVRPLEEVDDSFDVIIAALPGS